MDKDAADFFKTSYDEFIADGGKVDGIVDWIGEPAEAEKVRSICMHSVITRSQLHLAYEV